LQLQALNTDHLQDRLHGSRSNHYIFDTVCLHVFARR